MTLGDPTPLQVIERFQRGEAVDRRQLRVALETLLAAWDDAAMHGDRLFCMHRFGRRAAERFAAAADEMARVVTDWQVSLSDLPLDTRAADEADFELSTIGMRP